jgi:hypothetical protein
MGFTLDSIVPWGRSYDEYLAMFGLTKADLSQRILGCGDGPASFNAELARRGGRIVSVDPIYAYDTRQIRDRIDETYETVLSELRRNRADYVWSTITSVDALARVRMSAMGCFLSDYAGGRREGRYVAGELPSLPFDGAVFDIALSSHFLFLYSAHLSLDFHIESLTEMLRVASEARIFPVLTLAGVKSPYLDAVIEAFRSPHFEAELRRVPYEFQRGGNEMLVVRNV